MIHSPVANVGSGRRVRFKERKELAEHQKFFLFFLASSCWQAAGERLASGWRAAGERLLASGWRVGHAAGEQLLASNFRWPSVGEFANDGRKIDF